MKRKRKFFKVLSAITAISCLYSSYGITDIVTAEETTSDFDPYFFYEEILNEKRPEEAEHFRFIDLDKEGYDELLIYSRSCILTVYTVDKSKMQPKSLFYQSDGSMRNYQICTNGIISYSLSPNQHGSYIGHIRFKLSYGQLEPFLGYAYGSYKGKLQAFITENKDILSSSIPFHYDNDFSKWDSITDEEFNNLFRGKSDNEAFTPWMEDFFYYDQQREFEKSHNETPLSITGRYGYDEFLKRYKDYVSKLKWQDMRVGSIGTSCLRIEDYSEEFRSYLSQNKSDLCFILRDLNEDGTRELVTGGLDENGDFKFFDLYTIYDNRIFHLAASATNHRNIFTLNKENKIIWYLNGGASNEEYKLYDTSKGSLILKGVLKLEKGQYYNYENFGTASENKIEINQKEYNNIREKQYARNLNQDDVVMLKDWYPGMRINEDPDGDANDDGEINMLDVILVHKHILSTSGETVVDNSFADINMDNTVNVIDLMLLKRKLINP